MVIEYLQHDYTNCNDNDIVELIAAGEIPIDLSLPGPPPTITSLPLNPDTKQCRHMKDVTLVGRFRGKCLEA